MKEVLLARKNPNELSAYILMDRINPPTTKNYILRPGNKLIFTNVVSELGIYGVLLG